MGSNTVRIVAVPDRLVRDPLTRRPVDEVGIDIDPLDLTWSRMIADEDVAVVDDEPSLEATDPASAPSAPDKEA
ncbi:hypothetical protein [Sphingomonas sp. UYP23]